LKVMKTKVCKGKSVRLTHRLALLTLFLCVFSGVKAQDYSGYWFIASNGSEVGGSNVSYGYNINTPETNYYLRYAADPTQTNNIDAYWFPVGNPAGNDSEKPFLTTNKTDYALDLALWKVVQSGNRYFIIHVGTGKYVKYEPCLSGNYARRKSMHLEDCSETPTSDAFKFELTGANGSDIIGYDINIRPESVSSGHRFCNVSDRNRPSNHGEDSDDGHNYYGGLVGLYNSATELNSKWRFEPVPRPDINFDAASGSYTITWHGLTVSQLPSGYEIHYTEDGNDPTITSAVYDGSTIVVENDNTTVQAILTGHGQVLSGIATQVVNTAAVAAPTFEVTCDSKLQINCNVSTATIYYSYTTDGTTEPDNPSNDLTNPNNHYYEGAISGFLDGYKVKAIAYNGSHVSDVSEVYTFYNNTPAPSVTLSENAATVTFGSGETIYYTTDGSHPFPGGNTATQSPHDITGLSYDVDVDIRVVATSHGRGNSCPVTVVKRPKQPTINASNVCEETNKVHSLTFDGTEPGKTYWYALSNGSDQPAPDPDIFTYTEYTPGSTVDIAAIPAWNGTDIWVTLHAYAMTADGFRSHLVSENYMLKYTDAPSITYVTGALEATVTITAVSGATIQYSVDGGSSWQTYSEPFRVLNNYTYTVIAKAKLGNEGESCEVTKIVRLPKLILSLTEIDDANGAYDLTANIDASSFTGFSSTFGDFTGSLNGNGHTISNLHVPLFNVINGGTVNNLFFDNVSISTNGNVGVVCSEATGASRIYNCGVLATNSTVTTDEDGYTIITDCSSTISGTSYVGGIVGLLKDDSRVINCFSYANITGGNVVGGIVGRNDVATTSGNLKTMVMNCMFYGDITGGSSKAPIYNGKIINNYKKNNVVGVSNFNYFWAGASYVQNKDIDVYNCALSAETRFLQRFEFFRQLLNSYRELAAWWVTGNRGNKDEMLKWVMEPSQIGTSTPYPILKTPGKYPSVVNYDAANAVVGKPRNQGGKLGELTVNIRMGDGGPRFSAPSGAEITTSQLTLNITDKDTTHFNFNYYKVQLPYYNDVGTKNYTGNRVVTGWKIVSITVDGTPTTTGTGSYDTGADVTFDASGNITKTPYNFADRTSTKKDLYSVSGRVFSQGAYWDVPEGVTAITIEPYWAKAAYVADAYADVVYDKDMTTRSDVTNVGGGNIYENNTSYSIAGDNQIVYTSISNAIASTALAPNTSHTVNDYAVVLVGNCHHVGSIEASKPYTLTSIDLDHDNEPDYTLILRFNSRLKFHPVKYDFLSLVGLGMAQKSADGFGSYNFGIPQPIGWFEVTNTALFRVTQFEYDLSSDRVAAPIILQGGVMEQWVSGQLTPGNQTTYFHVGGNVWFKEFHLGCHQDKTYACIHPPISVTGGDFDAFHLTGLYADASNYNDNAECYVNGGRFGTVAGTGMDGIGNASSHTNGYITWLIDNADIKEFFAGGINDAKRAEGNINTIISNSYVDFFCGGPKFGDMNAGRTVKTTATDCTFGFFFGAGYGGNSYYSAPPGNFTYAADPWLNITHGPDYNDEKQYNLDWNQWVNGDIKATLNDGNYANGVEYKGYHNDYISQFGGVSTEIDYQFLPFSDNVYNVARLFLKFVKFSLATTHSVTSTLTGCTINNGFYGGGSLGKVEGSVESVLDGCTVKCDAFGAGYSATLPTVPVMATGGFAKQPYYDKALGAYLPGEFKGSIDYTWDYKASIGSTEDAINKDDHILYTTIPVNDKTNLGKVTENVFLTIKGNSIVFKNVFGGGAESQVGGNTEVKILEQTKVFGNIYGGGDMGEVVGNTKVIVNGHDDSSGGGSGGGGS
jgi:hypothetical protein